MILEIQVNTAGLNSMLKRFPEEMKASIEIFKDRVGYKLDRESKKEAPAISGNLRRNIVYNRGALIANANYSKFVHGKPFYQNKMRRKETPFITNAISNSETFIKTEARALVQRVIK